MEITFPLQLSNNSLVLQKPKIIAINVVLSAPVAKTAIEIKIKKEERNTLLSSSMTKVIPFVTKTLHKSPYFSLFITN